MAFEFGASPLGYIFAFLAVALAIVSAALAAALAEIGPAPTGTTTVDVSKQKEMKDMGLAQKFFKELTIPFAVVAAGLLIAKV
jgi:hypothetical protein